MKKITLSLAFMLISVYTFSQFTTGEIELTDNANNNMNVTIETNSTDVTLTLMGPDNKWFAVGFGGVDMASVSDVFVYDGTENFDKVGHDNINPTDDANQDWMIISNTVDGIYRTIQATRPLSTDDADDYTFINDDSNIDVIWAYGTSLTLEYHAARYFKTITRSEVANINTNNTIKFAMYPNPVNTELNIVLPSNLKNAEIEIFNILGKKISSKKLNNTFNKLDVSNLKSGIYLIKINGDNNSIGTKQFVKK